MRLRSEEGIALFMVFWVLTMLSVLVTEFCFTIRTEVNATRNFKARTEAHYIAYAGLTMAIDGLIETEITVKRMTNPARDVDLSSTVLRVNVDIPEVPFARGTFKVRIDNETGKINLNTAGPELLRLLFMQFDLPDLQLDIIVDSIQDWRDADSLHRLNGAENEYYQSLAEPYKCKNGFFETPEELMLVKGVTPEMVSGVKPLVTIFVPPLPFDEEELKKETYEAFRLREKKKKYKGPDYDHINPNAASREVLLLIPGMTAKDADNIVEYRKQGDLKSVEELLGIIGEDAYQNATRYFRIHLIPFYTLTAVGNAEDGHIRAGIKAFIEVNPKLKKKYRFLSIYDM